VNKPRNGGRNHRRRHTPAGVPGPGANRRRTPAPAKPLPVNLSFERPVADDVVAAIVAHFGSEHPVTAYVNAKLAWYDRRSRR